jgi:polar amino acid transport system substrate-binding protein/cystine transport system substrate-binding protein/membrane-bound lytic murein transglycosylase F
MTQGRRTLRDLLTLLPIFGLLLAVYLLPPDTSLAQVQRVGVLRVCIPDRYPPLVTRDSAMPGIDIELLQAVANDMGLRLSLNTNSAMGRDFNPRNWRVTRAQCQLLAGGVVASQTTRSFLDTSPAYLETGWALVLPRELASLDGAALGFHAGVAGLDRIALSRFLRNQGAHVTTVNSSAELIAGLEQGRFDAGVTEGLNARQIAGDNDWRAEWLPESLGRYPIVFGLWKGDLTLKRRVVSAIESLRRQGALEAILMRYELAPIAEECVPCR